MIREDRDPTFWQAVAEHPDVAPHVFLGSGPLALDEIIGHPSVVPLRAEHGGFLFCQLDGFGRVYELHTLFTPEGWGREVLFAAKAAFAEMFARGAQVICTYEVEGWWRSRPPRSFGFQRAGDFGEVAASRLSTWILTQSAWESSPARRRA